MVYVYRDKWLNMVQYLDEPQIDRVQSAGASVAIVDEPGGLQVNEWNCKTKIIWLINQCIGLTFNYSSQK